MLELWRIVLYENVGQRFGMFTVSLTKTIQYIGYNRQTFSLNFISPLFLYLSGSVLLQYMNPGWTHSPDDRTRIQNTLRIYHIMLNILPEAKHDVLMLRVFVLNKTNLAYGQRSWNATASRPVWTRFCQLLFLKQGYGRQSLFSLFIYLNRPQLRKWNKAVFLKCLCIMFVQSHIMPQSPVYRHQGLFNVLHLI